MTQAEYIARINRRLEELMAGMDTYQPLRVAMEYSIRAGGKRIRPRLLLMANALFTSDQEECLDDACGVEMIHTYSLIHDDLPAMDNDDLRRGQPTNHVVFGDAAAILAGDGLLTFAFEVMARNAIRFSAHATRHLQAIYAIGRGAGVEGMLAGQCADVELEGQILTEGDLRYIHEHKTGALITAALEAGAILGGADEKQLEAVREYGNNVGLTFQIVDDVLDIVGSKEALGKTTGKDSKSRKFTFPTLFGVDKSRELAKESNEKAIAAIRIFGSAADPLIDLANAMLARDH